MLLGAHFINCSEEEVQDGFEVKLRQGNQLGNSCHSLEMICA